MHMLTMPAHSDVPAGLKQLKDAGFRLVTLTNSPPDPQASPLKHAGIDGWFERSFSIDRVRRFKPAPQVVPHGRGRAGRAASRDLHGGGARLGYHRRAEHRMLGSARRPAWQRTSSRAWVAATASCRARSSGYRQPIDQAMAVMPLMPESR